MRKRVCANLVRCLPILAFLWALFVPVALPQLAWADDALGLPGLINTDCPERANREPVVLIHGTFATTRRAFSSVAPALKQQGHCLFALNYGKQGVLSAYGTQDINASVQDLSVFVQSILQRTGAEKVNIIGHSQGGLIAFKLAQQPSLQGRIERIIAVAPSISGTTRVLPRSPIPHCPACRQQSSQSDFITTFRDVPVLPMGVQALIIATRQDRVVTPVEAQFLRESGVTNVMLQDHFPGLRASHSGLMHVPEAVALMRDYLGHVE